MLVEFSGASHWYNASLTISAGWLRQQGKVLYSAWGQSPDDVRSQLNRLGLNLEELENNDSLRIYDAYTTMLGQKSKEKYSTDTLKVSDLSISYSRDFMRRPLEPALLRIIDNSSGLARFNDEKACVEFWLTRVFPTPKLRKLTEIRGLMRGVHSGWVYEQLEAAADGVIEFDLDRTSDPPRNLMRITQMRNVAFDGKWHQLKIGENFEVTLE